MLDGSGFVYPVAVGEENELKPNLAFGYGLNDFIVNNHNNGNAPAFFWLHVKWISILQAGEIDFTRLRA